MVSIGAPKWFDVLPSGRESSSDISHAEQLQLNEAAFMARIRSIQEANRAGHPAPTTPEALSDRALLSMAIYSAEVSAS